MNLVIKKHKVKEFLLYLFVFFPYLTMFTQKIDTSVYTLIYSIMIMILYKNIRLPKELIYLFLLFILALLLMTISGFNFNSMRNIAGYFSIFIIASATYYILKQNNFINKELIYKFTLIWFIVGLVQTFFYKSFLSFLIVRSTSSFDRGVTSLAPEPTYYGTVAIFLFFIAYINNYKVKETLIITIITLLFLSKSSTGVIICLVCAVFYLIIFILNKRTFLFLFVAILFSVILIYIFLDFIKGSRLEHIILMLFDNPAILFTSDGSANARLWHIIGAFKGAYDNWFLPHGFNAFRESLLYNFSQYPDFVHPYSVKLAGNKIMSGTGAILFELGFFGLIYIYTFLILAQKALQNIKKALFVTFSILLIMTTAIPLTYPMFGFVYGLLAFAARRKNANNTYS